MCLPHIAVLDINILMIGRGGRVVSPRWHRKYFHDFPQSLQADDRVVSEIRHDTFLTSFEIPSSLFILHCRPKR
jgi:hypothetical protein